MIGYLISSHIDYSAPRLRLLESTRGINPNRIVVVVGGCPAETRRMWHHPIVEVTHNSYDYTALIDYVEHADTYPDWSHLFLLHDTMELGPDADYLIGQADRSKKAVAVWGGQCNLMLLRADYVRQCEAQLLGLKNCSKRYAVEMEGFLWRHLPESERGIYAGDCQQLGVEQTYGGAERLREYYSGVDITKYKANWGQPGEVVVP